MTFPSDILEVVLARSTSCTSSLHGLAHWERVRENGFALIKPDARLLSTAAARARAAL